MGSNGPDADGGVRSSLCRSNKRKLYPRRWRRRPRGCLETFTIGIPPPAANRETRVIEVTGKRQVAPTGDQGRRGGSWRDWEPRTLLVGMGSGAAPPLGELGPRDPLGPRCSAPGRVPQRTDNVSPDLHGGSAHRRRKAENPPMSSHRRTGKQNGVLVPPHERMLLGREKERSATHTTPRADRKRPRFGRRSQTRETTRCNASVCPKRPARANLRQQAERAVPEGWRG